MLPKFIKVKQSFPRDRVEDLTLRLEAELVKLQLEKKIMRGDRVAITSGSRGINGISQILAGVAARVRSLGGEPLIISAMGSHGNGTPEGQQEILASLNITEKTVGCPVICSSDVVKIGITPTQQIDVYCAKEAVEADGLIVVNRVKCHTAFRAPRESGLLKMMGIGLGRVPGADAIHSIGTEHIGQVILELARVVFAHVKVLGGIAIVENGYEETEGLYGLCPSEFEEQEALLLQKSNRLLPRLPLEKLDLLIVEEMGKDISGTGMDSNIIGRWRISGMPEPEKPQIKRLVVLELSESSHGNANGIGLADFTTRRLVDKIDFQATYLNCMTTGFLQRGMIPLTMENDRRAIEIALESLKLPDISTARIMRIKNTLHLDEVWASENLSEELLALPNIEILSPPQDLAFDSEGRIVHLEYPIYANNFAKQ